MSICEKSFPNTSNLFPLLDTHDDGPIVQTQQKYSSGPLRRKLTVPLQLRPLTFTALKQRLRCCCCCSVAQSCPTLCDPWTAAHQASLSSTISWSLLRFMSIESAMLSNHLVLWCPLLLPSIFTSITVFCNDLSLHIRWPQSIGASASASVLPMNIQAWFL